MQFLHFLVLFFINSNMKQNLTSFKRFTALIITLFCSLIFILFPTKIKDTVISSLEICLNTVFPAVFPMLIISYIFTGLGFSDAIKSKLHPLTVKAFGLSGNCTEAILSGMLCGYNSAAKIAVRLYKQEIITKEEAKRLSLFFSSPGISFCINIAGLSFFNNKYLGLEFLISSSLTCLISAITYNLFNTNKSSFKNIKQRDSVIDILIRSVSGASDAILSIVSWIIVFNIVIACFNAVTNEKLLFIKLFGEAVSAVKFSSVNYPLYVSAFCLFFGGLSIFLQQLPDIASLGIHPTSFLLIRLCQATLCSVIQLLLLYIFPVTVNVSNNITFHPFSHSSIGSFALLLLCYYLIKSLKETFTATINNK